MLLNTLMIIETLINEKFENIIDSKQLTDFLKHYKKGTWIYPGVIKRKFNLQMKVVYQFLHELEKIGILQSYYELYCSSCQKSNGLVTPFNEIPDFFECELCHAELPALENSILIYKVLKDD